MFGEGPVGMRGQMLCRASFSAMITDSLTLSRCCGVLKLNIGQALARPCYPSHAVLRSTNDDRECTTLKYSPEPPPRYSMSFRRPPPAEERQQPRQFLVMNVPSRELLESSSLREYICLLWDIIVGRFWENFKVFVL